MHGHSNKAEINEQESYLKEAYITTRSLNLCFIFLGEDIYLE